MCFLDSEKLISLEVFSAWLISSPTRQLPSEYRLARTAALSFRTVGHANAEPKVVVYHLIRGVKVVGKVLE